MKSLTTDADRDQNSSDSPVGLARRHGLGIATVYREIARGALRARKCGRRTIITRDDEAAWLANMPVKSAAQTVVDGLESRSRSRRKKSAAA